ncbi:cardiac-enriched FHL2-interacting protein [Protobothrops mucrosquamatus]|uniref:cardiac-enriched FHL2-interacting protein n=1 Tax=Protobothrops mucrosquamatus TaxID=103944 RepID=UPI0010FB648E|nr:cardiac-enriched FHL2-interacting protein [Protobothrops mucrosquamatus]
MQGSKKHADGQSDSSSIGSLPDDTDREVCSLTDRAFKSLCVAELQTPYTEADPIGPSGISHQFSSKFFHGPWNSALKKNTNFHRQLSEKERATFLLSKVSTNCKTHEDKKYSLVSPSIRRKLDLPLSDLHNCTHISKVSSLIKTFNKVDNQVSLLIAKQPANSSWTGCPLICGDETAFWSDRTIVNIQAGISELPDPRPSVAGPSDQRKGHSKIDLACLRLPVSQLSQAKASNVPRFSISDKMVKTRTGKAKELARKSSFLHSENSAFESWNAHHKKRIEIGETMPKDGSLGYFEERPFFKKPCVSEPKAMAAFMLEESFSDDPSPKSLSKASLPSVPLAGSPEVAPLAKTSAAESPVVLSDPSFGISALLAPALPLKPKNEGPPGNRLLVVTPFVLEAAATKEAEERAFYSQNDYKSKAPRLLFNLKDIRKRVKSTYTPSPLPRGLEDKSKLKGQAHLKADVMATSELDYSNKEILGGADKVNIFEQMDYIQEKDNFTGLNENFISDDVMLSLSKSRAGILKYQNKNHLQQSNSVYTEGVKVISVHKHNKTQPASSSEPFLTEVAAVQQEDMQEHKYKKIALGQDADESSKNLFYPAEENRSNSGTQACSSTGNGPQGGRSPSPSEQPVVTTADQPFHRMPCSLMQLFQKACLQESQRRGDGVDGGEQQGCQEREKAKKKDLHDHLLSNSGAAVDETDKGKDEHEDVPQEAALEEKEEDGWRSTDCEAESKAGEPLTPAVSSLLKPTLFTIKDNTFKSPPVTKAIKLPLLRSLSCEGAAPNAPENPKNAETDREGEGEGEEEEGWGSIQGNRGSQVADKSSLTANYSFSEGLDHFSMMADSEETDRLSVLSEKELKSPEKLAISKEEIRIRKLRPSSAIQPNLDFESEPRQSEERSPTRERTLYTKSRAFSRQRGGPCIKKIISQEVNSPTVTENHACSPVSSDAFGGTSSLLKQTYQLPGDPDSPLGTNERLQLMSQMGRTAAKPPTVPPKTEKALRRAKKLASRRKKMEAQQKKLEEETLPQNEDASCLTPAPSLQPLIRPDSPLTAPKCGPIKHQPLLSSSPSPSLPATQRKLLQDPDSGEYFMVDLPLRLKTLYDPESGRYVQVSAPSSRRNLSRTPSSEVSFPTCAWGPSTLPPRVASVPTLPSSTPLPGAFVKASGTASGEPLRASCPGPSEGPPCPDAALPDIHSQSADGSPSNSEKGRGSPAPQTGEGTKASAEEFAVEGAPPESLL